MDTIKRAGAAALLFLAALFLISCDGNHPKSVATDPVSFAVPVATGCVGRDGHATAPTPLQQRYPPQQWAAMPPGAKAQAVAAQAGERLNYEDRERAATAGCR